MPTLLVLRPLGLGDFLTAIPAYRALADAFPRHRRVLAASRAFAELAALCGGIDDVVETQPLAPLDARLHGAEVAVDLHGRGPQSMHVLLAARPARLIAFENAAVPQTAGAPRWRPGEHEVERWCRLLRESGVPADARRLRLRRPDVLVPKRLRGATVVHPGAASEARRWPALRWAAVARAARAWGPVVITGSRAERPLAAAVAGAAGISSTHNLAGRTSLPELAALIADARALVCGDTGVAHLATAFGTRSVVLFGPVSPAEWGPPAGDPRHTTIWKGRRGDPHAATPDAGLLRIAAADVIAALASHAAPGAPCKGPLETHTDMPDWATQTL